ncbi:amidase protein [Apiospora rasikravindrae]|uniref:Amidase protein n=1 Tax=Apiospora rasikravindrae TaxID=990691 RepID=A0ABR1RQU0_9PEZI
MVFLIDYLRHLRDCRLKQNERAQRIRDLPQCREPLTKFDREVIDMPIVGLVRRIEDGSINPKHVLRTYGKVALKAHEKTNCLTEIMISEAEASLDKGRCVIGGLLNGIPVSLKDSIDVGGFDTTVGYSSFVGNKQPPDEDGPMVQMLKDMGAVPYVKTNLPTTLLSFESTNDVWGRSTNPHNSNYSPGGSTGGEAALLALGGRIGIGSDVAGSVRVPAHFSGIYSLRCSTGRWPKAGVKTSMPGQEGVPSVFSPMARTLGDLRYFVQAMIEMKPWVYDHSVHPMPWDDSSVKMLESKTKLRVGVMRTDGVVNPSPACVRALEKVEAALEQAGCEIVEIHPPSPYDGLVLGSQLLNADGCRMFSSFFRTGERNDPGAAQLRLLMSLPRPVGYMYYLWVKYIRRDDVWAGLVRDWYEKSAFENWQLVAKREAYRKRWSEWWADSHCDFLITPPNATPAVPHGAMRDAVSSCGYTFLFNVLDYTCGIVPVTHVDKNLDQLPPTFDIKKLNGVAQGAYKHYDATAMHGLPVGVQIVGRRLEEEKVLVYMKKVEAALGADKYEPISVAEIAQ